MMQKFSFSLLSVILFFAGCGTKETQETTQASKKDTLYLVNVLDPQMFADAHIVGSINVSMNDLEKVAAGWNKDAHVVIYCSNYMCTASGQAAEQLKKLGFKHVYAYEGGTAEWYQLSKKDPSYKLNGPQQQAYLNIVLEKPTQRAFEVEEISAQELKNLLKEANILS